MRELLGRIRDLLRRALEGEVRVLRAWQWVLRAVVVLVGAVVVWRTRFYMNPDGVSYVDMGDALVDGEWGAFVNRYWNPLYPLVLLLFRAVSGFSAQYEIQVLHLATFCLYLLCLVGLEFMVRQMIAPELPRGPAPDPEEDPDPAAPVAPRAVLVLLAYPFFLWFTVVMVNLYFITPDLLVAAAVLFAAGMVARFRTGRIGVRGGAVLGLLCGLAYLAKAAMLFVGVGFVGAAWLAAGLRRGFKTFVAATVVYLAVAGPWIGALSAEAGRLTFSDSGRLNYAWMVHGVSAFAHAGRNAGSCGTLDHPPEVVSPSPRVYEFAEPVYGTYPLWFDPAYWYEGIQPPFDWERQQRILEQSRDRYKDIAREQRLPIRFFLVALLLLFAVSAPRGILRTLWGAVRRWQLLLPALAPFLMYSLVAVKARYLGPFAFLLGMGLLFGVQVPRERRRWLLAPALALSLVLTYTLASDALRDEENRWDDEQWRVAAALHERGIEPGARLGHVGYTFGAYWARLGRFRIIAEVPRGSDRAFWHGNAAARERAVDAFRRAGAEAVVATGGPSPGEGWERLANGGYWLLVLQE